VFYFRRGHADLDLPKLGPFRVLVGRKQQFAGMSPELWAKLHEQLGPLKAISRKANGTGWAARAALTRS
jgi:hypothetical protein